MITRKRLFAYATLIAAVLWTVWAVDVAIAGPLDRMGKVKGTDFIQFYVIGSIVHEGRWDHLYDARTEATRTQAIAPTSRETLYLPIESPQMALAFAPLAAFSYTTALAIWLALGALLYAGACALLWRDCQALRAHRAVAVAACAAFPGFFAAVLHGQTSWVSLVCVVAALAALRRGYRLAAGVALGLLVFKPHWALAAGAVFFFAGEWRVVAGIAAAAIAQTTLAYAVVGPAVMQAYWRTLRALPRIADLLEPVPGDSLRGYFQAIVPSPAAALALYAAASLTAMAWTARFWRSDADPDLRLASVVIAIILVSPHVNPYDLILLAPVFFLVANWLVAHGDAGARARAMPPLLALLFLAPMLGGLPAVIRLQCSAGAMAALLFVVDRGRERFAVFAPDDGRLATQLARKRGTAPFRSSCLPRTRS